MGNRRILPILVVAILFITMIRGEPVAVSSLSNSSLFVIPDAWADSVAFAHILGTNNLNSDPEEALGAPNYDDSPSSGFVSLGGGELTIDLGEGEQAINGVGNDLRIYNPGTGSGESFEIYLSNQFPTDEWLFAGSVSGNGIASIDLEPLGRSEARYVRIVDLTNEGLSGASPGTDIDYIAAIHFPINPYANEVVSHLTNGSNNSHREPFNALGPPDYVNTLDYGYISLGLQGELILDMGEGEEITDGPMDDLRVVNPGGDGGEIAEVFLSNSPFGDWKYVGKAFGAPQVNDYDISVTGLRQARYVRILDTSTGDLTDRNPATDIDYIEALYLPQSVSRIFLSVTINN